MYLEPFAKYFPEIGPAETRVITLGGRVHEGGIPAGEYVLVESYCTDPTCE